MPKVRLNEKGEKIRDYDQEARNMIRDLSSEQLYELYEIVINMQQKAQSNERRKELQAVQRAVQAVPRLHTARLRSIRDGYNSEMARDARISDGSTRPSRKKV